MSLPNPPSDPPSTSREFPDGFWWGTAASSTQSEGAPPGSDWAIWERQGRAPTSGDGNGFASAHREDFRLWAEVGLTQHRLSLPWARLMPTPRRIDRGELERYRELLSAARDEGVDVWACLHHFTLPAWFADLGGFADPKAAGLHWPHWVDLAAEHFYDLVAGWKPINEPVAYAVSGYLGGGFAPGENSVERFFDVLAAMHVAWRDAWRILRHGSVPVCTVANLSPVVAADRSDRAIANRDLVDEVIWGVLVRLLRDGVLAIPGRAPQPMEDLADSTDLVGFSYYHAVSVDAALQLGPHPPGAPLCDLGYAFWPEGIGEVLERLASELPGRPLVVAELGYGTRDEGARSELLRRSLRTIADSMRQGADVRGVFIWTGVDNYEWLHGFDVPFGLWTRGRAPKPALELVGEVIRSGLVPAES